MKKIFISLMILSTLLTATPVHAALDYSGLVKCDGVVDKNEPGRTRKCDFTALIEMVNALIRWIFVLSTAIFVGLFAYAGFLYMKPSSGDREKANSMLWAAVKGFVIMLMAWFIVYTLLNWVVNPLFKGTDTFIGKNK